MKNRVSWLQKRLSKSLNKAISIAISLAILLNLTAGSYAQLLPVKTGYDFAAWQKENSFEFDISDILNGAYNRAQDADTIEALSKLVKKEYKGIELTAEELAAEIEFAYQAYKELERLNSASYQAGRSAYARGKAPDGSYDVEKYYLKACSGKEQTLYNKTTYECPAFIQGLLSGVLNDKFYKSEIQKGILEKGDTPASNNSVFAKVRDLALLGGVNDKDYARFINYISAIAKKAPQYCDNDIYLVDYMPGIEYSFSGKSRGLKEKSAKGKQKRQLDCINSGEAMVLLALLGKNPAANGRIIYDSVSEAWDGDYGAIALESGVTALSLINDKDSWAKIEHLLLSETLKNKGIKGKAKAVLELLSIENAAEKGIGVFNRYIRGGGGNYLNGYGEKTQYLIQKGQNKYGNIYGNVLEDIGYSISVNKSKYAAALSRKIINKYVREEARSYALAKTAAAQGNFLLMLLKRDTGNKIHTPLVSGVLKNKGRKDASALSARKLLNNLDWWDLNAATQTRVNNLAFTEGGEGLSKKALNDKKATRYNDNQKIKSAGYWTDMALMVVLTPALIKSIPSLIRGGANLAKTSYRLSKIKLAGKSRLLKAVKIRGEGINIAAIKADNLRIKKLYDARKSAISKLRARRSGGKNISAYRQAKADKATAEYKLAKSERDIAKAQRNISAQEKAAIEAEINTVNQTNKSMYEKYIAATKSYNAKVNLYNTKAAQYNALSASGENAKAQQVLKELETLKAELSIKPQAPKAVQLSKASADYIARYRSYEANLAKYAKSSEALKTARANRFGDWLKNSKLGRWWNSESGNGLIFNHSGKTETTLAEAFNIKGEYKAPTLSDSPKISPLNRIDNVYKWLDNHHLGLASKTLRIVNNKATVLGTTLLFNYNVATVTPGMLNGGRVLAATEQVANFTRGGVKAANVFNLNAYDIAAKTGISIKNIRPVDVVDPKILSFYNGIPLIGGNILQGRGAAYWTAKLASGLQNAAAGVALPVMLARDVYRYADGRLLSGSYGQTQAPTARITKDYNYGFIENRTDPSSWVYEVPGRPHLLRESPAAVAEILGDFYSSASVGNTANKAAENSTQAKEEPKSLLGKIAAFLKKKDDIVKPSAFLYNFLAATTVTATAPMISQVYGLDTSTTNTIISLISYLPAGLVPFMGYFFNRWGVINMARTAAVGTFLGVGLTVLGGLNGFTNDGSTAGLISSLAGISLVSLSNEIKYSTIYPLIDVNFDAQRALGLTTQTAMARSLGTILFLEFGPLLNFASQSLGFGEVNNAITFPLLLAPLSLIALTSIFRGNFRDVPLPESKEDGGLKGLVEMFFKDAEARKAAISFALIEAGELTTSLLVFSMAQEHYGALSDMPNILGGVLIYTAMGLARALCGELQKRGILSSTSTYKISGGLVLSGLTLFALEGISPLGLTGAALFFIGDANLFPPLFNAALQGRGEKAANTTLLIFSFSVAAAAAGTLLSFVSDLTGSLQVAVLVPVALSGGALALAQSIFKKQKANAAQTAQKNTTSFDFSTEVVYASGEKEGEELQTDNKTEEKKELFTKTDTENK